MFRFGRWPFLNRNIRDHEVPSEWPQNSRRGQSDQEKSSNFNPRVRPGRYICRCCAWVELHTCSNHEYHTPTKPRLTGVIIFCSNTHYDGGFNKQLISLLDSSQRDHKEKQMLISVQEVFAQPSSQAAACATYQGPLPTDPFWLVPSAQKD